MRELGQLYPDCGYGRSFKRWLFAEKPHPYGSCGNGAAMRVSACGWAGKTLEEAGLLSRKVTEVTHNHPEELKGAEAAAVCLFMARSGKSCDEIERYVNEYYYSMNFTLDKVHKSCQFDATCQNSTPQAIKAFLESKGFEDALRNAISIGGDSDTLTAITGSVAEARYGIPQTMRERVFTYLDKRLIQILQDFGKAFAV